MIPPHPAETPRTVTAVTYNIHCCVGADRRHDPDRVARVIRELDADIVGLQEVDARHRIEDGCDQLEYLAAATGMHGVYGPALQVHAGRYGNGLLTRWPARTIRRFEIGMTGFEARGVLDVELDIDDLPLRTIVTHFGLRERERRRQSRMLLDILKEAPHEQTIVLGDFNEWAPYGRSLQCLYETLGPSRGIRSFPSAFPMFPLDRIWALPPGAVRETYAHRSRLARSASDHLPVCARVDLQG